MTRELVRASSRAAAMAMKKKPAKASPVLGPYAAESTPKDRENVRIRKINNGFIVSRDGVKGGKFFETEHFTPTAPKIEIPKPVRKK